jgi:hypothetical protein
MKFARFGAAAMHVAKVVGWNGTAPSVPAGLKVQASATGLAICPAGQSTITGPRV